MDLSIVLLMCLNYRLTGIFNVSVMACAVQITAGYAR